MILMFLILSMYIGWKEIDELSSSGLSLAATFAESPESDTFCLDFKSLSTITPAHVAVSYDGQAMSTSTKFNGEDLAPAWRRNTFWKAIWK